MNTGYERKSLPAKKPSYKGFLLLWVLLIGIGACTAYLYSDYMKRSMEANIAAQTEAQLEAVKKHYELQLEQTKAEFAAELQKLGAKVDAFNELLTFANDNASSRTDNSNQLYTQLQDVKKKLDELQKAMEMLR